MLNSIIFRSHITNFIYTHKKGVALLALVFVKLTNVEQHYVQIPYNKFHLHP